MLPLERVLLLEDPVPWPVVRGRPPDLAGREGVAPLAEAGACPLRPPLPPTEELSLSGGLLEDEF